VFGGVVNVTVEGDGVGDAELKSPMNQAVLPPSAADDVEVQVRNPRS